MKKSSQRIHQILRKAPSIKHLLKEADADHNRLIRLRQILPDQLASHCIDVHQQNGRLIVYLNSPAWASRLRLMTPKIIESFGVRQLICRVHSEQQKRAVEKPPSKVRHSDSAADYIESAASEFDDPEMAAIMKRLARAVRPKR